MKQNLHLHFLPTLGYLRTGHGLWSGAYFLIDSCVYADVAVADSLAIRVSPHFERKGLFYRAFIHSPSSVELQKA